MKTTAKKILLLAIILLSSMTANAQESLSIDTIFGKYGKMKGSTMINLAKDVLGKNTRVDRYKCLITFSSPDIVKETEEAISMDFAGRKKRNNQLILKELIENGTIGTVYYLLEKEEDSPYYEYILYSNKNHRVTLIYIKGRFPYDQLEYELNILKNLFIKINH
jgi:hypothetical protein